MVSKVYITNKEVGYFSLCWKVKVKSHKMVLVFDIKGFKFIDEKFIAYEVVLIYTNFDIAEMDWKKLFLEGNVYLSRY